MIAPRISIVVPTYNRARILSRTLPALLAQEISAGEYEVIVVVDGSVDGTLEMLRRPIWGERLRFVSQPNRGLAAARNRGASEARGDLVLFLDDDMIAPPGLAAEHLREHGASRGRVVLGRMGLAGGVRRSFLKLGVEEWGRELAERMSAPGYAARFDDLHFGHASIGRAAFLAAGGFDESFVSFGNEDYDLGWRLIRQGVEVRFSTRAVAFQIYDKSFTSWLRDVYSVGRADVALAGKHPQAAPRLRLSGRPVHPIKRLARWSGLASLDPLAPAWGALAGVMGAAERLSIRGRLFGHAQSLIGERTYWRGVRDARQPAASIAAGAARRPGSAA